ncbi:Alpha-1,6-mannosylglycoprotein 6-beta-N-acetylglucosaminyltransferase A [Clonorchis sinensis]|uniref:alpha-1,6-mannosyl-glycoprotein 6-beta-N-acetylglucosaminyltransferase n=1 Tax=Clonorchis sinensis TaxID=79923 RepID=A0A419PC36_CLOSI|nr:Alpha-1,6-mannosylglycoprotein 6-beta-N-acetylglucosaminyltransferase A [Clonorchis sinensis]
MKTLAVLLHSLMQRISTLEAQISSIRHSGWIPGSLKSSGNFSIQNASFQRRHLQQQSEDAETIDYIDLLQGAQETCVLQSYRLLAFPECQSKIEWLRTHWKSHSCYEELGVDGSDCSIVRYLSEVEGHCPAIENRRTALTRPQAKVRTDLSGLLHLIPVDKQHQFSYKFIYDRLTRLWPEMTDAMQTLTRWSQCPNNNSSPAGSVPDWFASVPLQLENQTSGCPPLWNRPQLTVHLHLGFISLSASKHFESSIGRGGPLGELVQWTDLLGTLYMLGHRVSLSMEISPTLERLRIPEYGKTPCQVDSNLVDLIFTDITGYRQLRRANVRVPACKFRILDSFGTESAFNRQKATWGGLQLNLQQFFTMFPHSPDNTFLGFIVESFNGSRLSNKRAFSGKPIGLVYGKERYMWKGSDDYLQVLSEFLELHGNVADASGTKLPRFVRNHNRSYGQDYLSLLTSSQVMVGLGFPYEGPAPLEAIANGLVFLNPRFAPPRGRGNTAFFADKPTTRKLTSQQPYLEKYVGEPYSYLVDTQNATALRLTMRRVLAKINTSFAYRPFEFSPLGFLERLNALLTHQSFCDGAAGLGLLQSPLPLPPDATFVANLEARVNSVRWPPASSLRVLLAAPGLSCATACSVVRSTNKPSVRPSAEVPVNTDYLVRRSMTLPAPTNVTCPDCLHCAPEHFPTVNNRFTLEKHFEFGCTTVQHHNHPLAPFRWTPNNTCVFQSDRHWFDCVASSEDLQLTRICPCRDALPHQSAICTSCL